MMDLLNNAEFWAILGLILGFLGIVWTVVALLIKQPPQTTIAVKQGIDAMQDFAENRAKELKEKELATREQIKHTEKLQDLFIEAEMRLLHDKNLIQGEYGLNNLPINNETRLILLDNIYKARVYVKGNKSSVVMYIKTIINQLAKTILENNITKYHNINHLFGVFFGTVPEDIGHKKLVEYFCTKEISDKFNAIEFDYLIPWEETGLTKEQIEKIKVEAKANGTFIYNENVSKVNEIITLKEEKIEIKKRGRPKKVVNDIDNNYIGA